MEEFFNNILRNNDDENRSALELLVPTLKDEEISDLLSNICELIYKEKYSHHRIENILEPFDEEGDMNKIVIKICREFLADREEAKYIVQNLKSLSDVISILVLLFDETKSYNYEVVAENILYCYSYDLTNEDIEYLLTELMSIYCLSSDALIDGIANYLKSKRKFMKEDYVKPSWVSLQDGENVSLLATVPTGISKKTGQEITFDKIIDSANSFFFEMIPSKDKYGDEEQITAITDLPENVKESIKTFLQASTDTESEDQGFKVGITERVWGPKNAFKYKGCCSGPEGEGPCRMLQCECLNLDPDDDSEVYENKGEIFWFTGKCDNCSNFIMDASHALRFPCEGGGWQGCYCCFKCLMDTNNRAISKEENILLEITRATIEKYGIMDRSSFC